MITVDKLSRSPRYLISENAISFTENYQDVNQNGNPIYDVVAVSIVNNAAIMVFDENNGISYGNDLQYQRWKLAGATTGLVSPEAHNIYARLSKGNKKGASIVFSTYNYNTDGTTRETDEDGTPVKDLSDSYWMILIGTLSGLTNPSSGSPDRILTFDPGRLSTQQQQNEQSGGLFERMFDLVVDKVESILVKLPFQSIRVLGKSVFEQASAFFKGFEIGAGDSAKAITSVATDTTSSEDDETAIATPAYVKAFSESRYLRYDITEHQSVAGPVTFEQNVTVQGDHTVEGVQTIGKGEPGNIDVEKVVQEVKGKQILHGGFQTPNFNNAAGQITGAHLTPDGKLYVSGLKANNFEIDQLIFNVVKAQGGEYVYSTSCEIESCIYVMKDGSQLTPDAFYALADHDWQQIAHVLITLKEDEFTQYGNPFVVGDIIYGKVNQVQESGKHAVGGECIMHITAVEDNTLNITAQLYQVGEQGLVGNIPPIEDMVIAHRGNKDGVQGRTTSFYLSTITGNLVMLYNVTTPTLSVANYGASFGKLPYDLYVKVLRHYAGLQPEDPAVYAKLLVTENWIQMDHLGQPIKFEVYRGDWQYDVAVSDKPYIVTLSTYDTVTHNGAKWRVCTSNTVTEPRDGFGDWERLTDANITVYSLAPSSNIIYIRDAGVVTPSELDVTVKSTTSLGEEIISDQATLVSRNLTVWYTIDGGSKRKMLVLGGTKVFVTEDGSVFATEAENEAENVTAPLYLEGESIDLSKVSDNITLYLVENDPDNPVDKASYVIPVVNDGASPLGLELTPSALSVPVDATTLATAGVRDYESTVRLKQGVSYIDDISEYTMQLTYTLRSGEVGTSNILDTDYIVDDWSEGTGWKIYVQSGNGIVKNKQIERIDISILHGEAVIATGAILINYLERGITGPAGKEGPMLYPCGTWKEGAEYMFTYQLDSKGKPVTDSDNNPIIIAKPFVYNESDDNYYVLEKNVREGDNIKVTNTEYWKPFTKIQYIFTEALMADWANLASAIFNGDYMFSMKGIDRLGNYGDYSAYQEGKDSMFDNIGEGENIHKRLNGNFVPNLFLDFKSGEAKVGKLSETYTRVTAKEYAGGKICIPPLHVVNLDNCHNVSCQAVMNDVDGTCAVVLPKASNGVIVDGTHSIIVHEYNARFSDMPTDENYSSSVVAVCADEAMLDPNTDFSKLFTWIVGDDTNKSSDGWFIWRGYRTKLILLTPGSMLQLRSCVLEDGGMVWFIENSSDFEILNASFSFYQDYDSNTGAYSFSSNDTTAIEAIWKNPIVLGSPAINHIKGGGYDEGIVTSWVWNATGNLAEDTNNTGEDGYRGCYIMESRDIL